jgi:hypothetical protein
MRKQISRRGILTATMASAGFIATSHWCDRTEASPSDQVTSSQINQDVITSAPGFTTDFTTTKNLQGWQLLKVKGWSDPWEPLEFAVNPENALVIKPRSSGWFEDNYGGFLYQTIAGNFIITTHLRVTGRTREVPNRSFSLSGLFIRKPRSFTKESWRPGQENWLFFSTGSADKPGTPQFEVKSTYQSTSTLRIYPSRSGWMRLRIVRLGEQFTLLHQFDGEAWTVLDQFIRPDLPDLLQVGLTAYTDWDSVAAIYPDYVRYNVKGVSNGQPDLIAYVKTIEFRRPAVERSPIASLTAEQLKDFTQ